MYIYIYGIQLSYNITTLQSFSGGVPELHKCIRKDTTIHYASICNPRERGRKNSLHTHVKNKKAIRCCFPKCIYLKIQWKFQFWWNGQKYIVCGVSVTCLYVERDDANGILYKSSLNKTYEHTNQILSLGFFVYVKIVWHTHTCHLPDLMS